MLVPIASLAGLVLSVVTMSGGCFSAPRSSPMLRWQSKSQTATLAFGSAVGTGRATRALLAAQGEAAFAPLAEAASNVTATFGGMKIKALGGGRGSFLLEMNGQKLLFDPVLTDCKELRPENVHKEIDFVFLTSDREEFFHEPTIARMNLAKTNFVVTAKVAEKLSRQMAMKMEVLNPGPDAAIQILGEEASTPIAVIIAPGADGMYIWDAPGSSFVLVDTATGIAVAYEPMGQHLGPNGGGGGIARSGIPQAAYEIDFLITPLLRDTAGVLKGLREKGANIRAVIKLPAPPSDFDPNPLLIPLLAFDEFVDKGLGGVGENEEEFRAFLKKEGLEDIELLQPQIGGEAIIF